MLIGVLILKQRVKSAIVIIVIALLCITISDITRLLFFAIAGILCAYEYSHALEKAEVYCCAWVMYTYLSVQAILAFLHAGPIALIACFAFAVYLALFSGILHKKVSGSGALNTLAGVAYPCFLFSLLMVISVSEKWIATLFIAFVATAVCDTFALFGGKLFGKHKIAPRVSPHKTVEGCLCGALSSVIVGFAAYFMLPLFGAGESLACCLVTSFMASTLGQIGDLAESLIKRFLDIKDFSNVIPGHGGIFDRSDSVLFAIPTAYLFIYLFDNFHI